MVDPKIIIEGIPVEKLLEVYYKDLERKKKKTPGVGWFKILLRKKIHELENK